MVIKSFFPFLFSRSIPESISFSILRRWTLFDCVTPLSALSTGLSSFSSYTTYISHKLPLCNKGKMQAPGFGCFFYGDSVNQWYKIFWDWFYPSSTFHLSLNINICSTLLKRTNVSNGRSRCSLSPGIWSVSVRSFYWSITLMISLVDTSSASYFQSKSRTWRVKKSIESRVNGLRRIKISMVNKRRGVGQIPRRCIKIKRSWEFFQDSFDCLV